MKLKILGMIAGSTLLGLASTNASARTDVYVDLSLGIPAPVYVESRPVYYYDSEPAYYVEYREYPRYDVRYYERHRHDRGYHRGQHKHYKHKHRQHH